jgi:hypothetical protein
MSTPTPTHLTRKVLDLVARDRNARPPVGRLNASHVQQLALVATRREPPGTSAAHAIAALAEGAPGRALPVMEQVLEDDAAPQPDRVAAARALGVIATSGAEALILAQLPRQEPRVQQELLASLGTFGSASAAGPLQDIPAPADAGVARQLALTRALISHRHGLDGPFLPGAAPASAPRGTARDRAEVGLSVRSAPSVATDLRRHQGPMYGMPVAARGLALRCGPASWTIFLNKSLGPTAGGLQLLFERPWIAAVLAQEYPTGEGLVTRLVMLTRPEPGGARIEVARADGEVMYVGSARQVNNEVRFTVNDTERPGRAPASITGAFTSRGVQLRTAVVLTTRRGQREALDVR